MNSAPALEDIGAGDPNDVFGETVQQRRQISPIESIDVSTDEMLFALHPPRVILVYSAAASAECQLAGVDR
jgi:hypothetical protein